MATTTSYRRKYFKSFVEVLLRLRRVPFPRVTLARRDKNDPLIGCVRIREQKTDR